ncbi:MAG: M23 family metallopeptidase [Methylovulum sp.]|nr:M23 family metallopeptidase [Methylovulum sp.]
MNKKISAFFAIISLCVITSVFADESTGIIDAVKIVPNTTIQGVFDFNNDDDYFRFDLPTSTVLSLDASQCNYNYSCNTEILDTQGVSLYKYPSYNFQSLNIDAGTYYLKVSRNTQIGGYNLKVSVDFAPFNIAPTQNESLIDTRTPNYHWTAVDGATKYQLKVSPNGWANYYTVLIDSTKNCNTMRGECQYTPKDFYLPSDANYVIGWRVIAKDSTGKDMVSSDHINFTTNNDYYSLQRPLNNFNTARVMGQCSFGGYCARTKTSSAHNAVDFMTKGGDTTVGKPTSGTPVYAICDGVVKVASSSTTTIANRFTVIEHTCLGFTGKLYAYYGHINPSSGIAVSTKVTKGQQIGVVASYKSGGYDNSHLHFALATKYFSNGWGYVDIGKVTTSDCNKTSVTTRRDALLSKGWIDPASFSAAIGLGSLYLQGGASGNCNAPKQTYTAYPIGNSQPYYPYHN